MPFLPSADSTMGWNWKWVLHDLAEASIDLFRYPYLGNLLITREQHLLISYPFTNSTHTTSPARRLAASLCPHPLPSGLDIGVERETGLSM